MVQKLELKSKEEWYEKLIEDLKKTENTSIVLGKWTQGKRILLDFEKFGKPEYADKKVANIASDMDVSSREIEKQIQFARDYPEWRNVVSSFEGKSWHWICNEGLPEHEEDGEKKEKDIIGEFRGSLNALISIIDEVVVSDFSKDEWNKIATYYYSFLTTKQPLMIEAIVENSTGLSDEFKSFWEKTKEMSGKTDMNNALELFNHWNAFYKKSDKNDDRT